MRTADAEPLLTVADLAAYTGLPVATIYALNHKGTGPRRIRVGKFVRYRRSDVDRWLDANSVEPVA